MEIDVSDPSNLSLISKWNNGGYFGEMQDCNIYYFNNEPHILSIKNNEGFAILKIDNTTSVKDVALQKNVSVFIQNYPNPFNSTTMIRWQSPISGQTALVLFNVLGRKVKTLVNEFKQQGEYTLHFNSGELPSGTYFYQLKVGNHITTNKIMITK